jgi:hypothetical protein
MGKKTKIQPKQLIHDDIWDSATIQLCKNGIAVSTISVTQDDLQKLVVAQALNHKLSLGVMLEDMLQTVIDETELKYAKSIS